MIGTPYNLGLVSSLGAYANLILSHNPILYWRMGEAGTTAVDLSGNGLDGTLVNSPSVGQAGLIAHDLDASIHFDRSNTEYIELAHSALFNFGSSPFSLEVWFQAGAWTPSDFGTILTKVENGGDHTGYALAFVSDGIAAMNTRADDTNEFAVGTTNLFDGDIHHFVGTRDGDTHETWIDGVLEASQAEVPSSGTVDNSDSLFVARHRDGDTRQVTGTVDEVAVYGYRLTADQIKEHYDKAKN